VRYTLSLNKTKVLNLVHVPYNIQLIFIITTYGSVRDEAGGDRRGTRRGERRKFESRFFRYCSSWAICFFQNDIDFLF
jgi:hypothetical protein